MNVNDENMKLESVKKSCRAARICSRIIFFIMVVVSMTTLISGLFLMINPDKLNIKRRTDEANVSINKTLSVGSVQIGTIDNDGIKFANSQELTSSIPALQEYFDEHKDSEGLVIGVYLLMVGSVCFVAAVSMWVISSVFDIILKEGNPFADQVPKRILTSMIILTVVVAVTSGVGFAVLLAFVTWALYTILDYGKTLRTLSDETL